MRAAFFTGERQIAIRHVAEPEPEAGEVIVEVTANALCGSDLRPWIAGWPVTPGHEIAGTVRAPGNPLDGQRVAVYIPVFCGHCPHCRAGDTHTCENLGDLVGWQRAGGYAERLAAPERCLIPLPDDIPLRLGPLLLDAIGTTGHAVRLARRHVDTGPVLVVGAGPIGLGAIIVLSAMGYGPIAVAEPRDHRLAAAIRLGAEAAATEPRNYPLVIEASGKDAGRQMALERVASGGAVVQLGESDQWTIAENKTIRRKDFALLRSFYFPLKDVEANIALFRSERTRFETLVDEETGLDGLKPLFDAFAEGRRLKPIVNPGALT